MVAGRLTFTLVLLLLATAFAARVGSPRVSRERVADALAAHPRQAID